MLRRDISELNFHRPVRMIKKLKNRPHGRFKKTLSLLGLIKVEIPQVFGWE